MGAAPQINLSFRRAHLLTSTPTAFSQHIQNRWANPIATQFYQLDSNEKKPVYVG